MSETIRQLENTFQTLDLCSRDAITPTELLISLRPVFGHVDRSDKSRIMPFYYKFTSTKYSITITIRVRNGSSQYVHLIPYERFFHPILLTIGQSFFLTIFHNSLSVLAIRNQKAFSIVIRYSPKHRRNYYSLAKSIRFAVLTRALIAVFLEGPASKPG